MLSACRSLITRLEGLQQIIDAICERAAIIVFIDQVVGCSLCVAIGMRVVWVGLCAQVCGGQQEEYGKRAGRYFRELWHTGRGIKKAPSNE